MPIKATIANKPVLDDQGYVTATIQGIEPIDERVETKGKKQTRWAAQFRFDFLAEGTYKSITYQLWTGQNFNPEKMENGDYNKLTRMAIQLELITEKSLEKLNDKTMPDLESLFGKKVKFKLEPMEKRPGLNIPDYRTFVLVK